MILMEKIKVCAYTRVSTNSRDQENSFENQKTYFEREISKSDKYELTKIYADKGLTGTSWNKRDEFLQMLYDAGIDIIAETKRKKHFEANETREPKFKYIFVKNTSRFARNVVVMDIIRELQRKKVYVYFLDINKTTENESDITYIEIFLTFDENDSRDKSKKVRFGHLEGARKGIIHVNSRIYGYKYIQEENRLEIIPEEAEVVKLIYNLYIEGFGVRKIIKELENNKIKTREYKEFTPSTVKRILSNEKYYGLSVRQKYDTGIVFNKNTYAKLKSEKEWISKETDKIPAIITKEIFNKAQKIRNSKVNSINQRGIYKGISEYAGLIKCGKCGSNYTRNLDRGRIFYNCSLKKTKGSNICNNKNVSLKTIEEGFNLLQNGSMAMIMKLEYENKIDKLNRKKKSLQKKINQQSNERVNQLKDELEKQNNIKNNLLDLFIEGQFDRDELDKRREKIDIKIDELQTEITYLSKTNDEINEEIEEINRQIQMFNGLSEFKFHTKEEILDNIKNMIVIEKENKLYLSFDFGEIQFNVPLN